MTWSSTVPIAHAQRLLAGYERRHRAALAEVRQDLRVRVERVCDLMHGRVLVWDGARTHREQAALHAQGRSRRGRIVTWAEPGESPHEWGCAVDVVLHPILVSVRAQPQDPAYPDLWDEKTDVARGAWDDLGRAAVVAGLAWGGQWPPPKVDRPHLELPAWVQHRPSGWRELVQAALTPPV